MHNEVIVGLDFGSSRIKAAAYGRDGALVAASSAVTPIVSRNDGDDFLVLDMLAAAAQAISDLGCDAGSIAAIGLSSMGEVGTILTEEGLTELAFPSWYDRRGADLVGSIEDAWGAEKLLVATGNHMRTASTVAKLGHLATTRELPAGTFLGLCGALAWQLTGRSWQEAGIAVTSGVYDGSRREYIQEVWDFAGLGHIALPPVLSPGHAEPASTDLANRLGLAVGAPVVIAGHDHPVAAVGAGVRAGELGDSMGTGEALIAVMREELAASPALRAAALATNSYLSFEVWPPTGELLVVWERLRPGLAMRSFLDHSGLDRAVADAQAPDSSAGGLLTEEITLGMENGGGSPLPPTPEGWAELIDYYVNLANYGQELVRAATGADGVTVVTGGGLRSPRWRRAKATLGRAPMVVSTVEETGTRGGAAMAGVAAGWWGSAEDMPGGDRVRIGKDAVGDMERAVARIGS